MAPPVSSSELSTEVVRRLRSRGAVLVTVESCTGGGLADSITGISGASDVFWGGLVTYTEGAKRALARVAASTLKTKTAVSAETGLEMAQGGLRLAPKKSQAFAVATTGFAGPKGGTRKDPVGTCYVALAWRTGPRIRTRVERVSLPAKTPRARMKQQFSKRALQALLKVLSAALLLSGCSSGGGAGSEFPKGEHHIHRLALHNAQARRPVGAAADPKAELGDPTEKSNPLPDAQFDCQPLVELFRSVDAQALRKCLKSIRPGTITRYELVRENQPYWQLADLKKAPPCLKTTLEKISIPREIVFQSADEGELRCYAAGLDLNANRLAGVKLPINGLELKLEFPIQRISDEDRDLLHVLGSWAITPYLRENDGRQEFVAKYVARRNCERCFGKSKLYEESDRPVFWP